MLAKFNLLDEILKVGYWSMNGQFCILAREKRYGKEDYVLVFNKTSGSLGWNKVYGKYKKSIVRDKTRFYLSEFTKYKKPEETNIWKILQNIPDEIF